MAAPLAGGYPFRMEISSSATAEQGNEVIQTLLLKKALKADEVQQLALIESAKLTDPTQSLDSRLVGRFLNEKA